MPGSIPFLHVVTDDGVLSGERFVERATEVLEAGESDLVLHLRGWRATGRLLFELAGRLLPVARATGGLVLLNDRCDVAVAAGADGVHLPEHGMPELLARRLVGPQRLLGRSLHLNSPLDSSSTAVLDYLMVGAIRRTGSHPEREPAGTAVIHRFSTFGRPIVGIGGIRPEDAGELRRTGVVGIAVLSGVWGVADPAAAVAGYRYAWSEAA